MTKYFAILFFFFLCLFSTACHDDKSEDTTVDETNRQTIICFFPWSGTETANGLFAFLQQNVSEIKQAIIENKGFRQARFLCFMSDKPNDAALFEMKFKKGRCYSDTLKRYKNPDFSKAETIFMIFSDAMREAPADNYAAIVGGHGSGWLPAPSSAKKKTRFIGGYSGQFATDTQVFTDALKATGKKFQFVLFDNCHMANIEIAYDMKDVTDFIIASTSEIIERGIPYNLLFAFLVGNPDYQQFVNGFHDFYTSYRYPYGAIAAIDCHYVEKMAEVMRRINQRFKINSNQLRLVQILDGYSPAVFYDMGDYVSHLCEDQSLLNEFQHTLHDLVPYAMTTDVLYSEYSKKTFAVNTFSGITISDPSTNDMAKTKTESSWYKSTH